MNLGAGTDGGPGAQGAHERRNRPGIPQLSHYARYFGNELGILLTLERLPAQICMIPLRLNLVLSLKRLDQRRTEFRAYLLCPEGSDRLEGPAPFPGVPTKELLRQGALVWAWTVAIVAGKADRAMTTSPTGPLVSIVCPSPSANQVRS